MKLVIRRMKPEDAADIQALNTQLGYSYPADKIAARINFLLYSSSDVMLAAEADGTVIAYAHATRYETLYADKMANILAFVIIEGIEESEAISQQLYDEFEKQIRSFGFMGMRMIADTSRIITREFFVKNGFDSKRDLKHFIKWF